MSVLVSRTVPLNLETHIMCNSRLLKARSPKDHSAIYSSYLFINDGSIGSLTFFTNVYSSMKTGFNISTGIFVGFYTFFSRISNRNERNKYCASKTKCVWKYNCAINRAELQDCFCIADDIDFLFNRRPINTSCLVEYHCSHKSHNTWFRLYITKLVTLICTKRSKYGLWPHAYVVCESWWASAKTVFGRNCKVWMKLSELRKYVKVVGLYCFLD